MIQILVQWHTTVVNLFISRFIYNFYNLNLTFLENVFTRSSDKCYLNGNVYEPKANISKLDSALSLCVSGCFCDQKTNDK